MRTLAMGGLHIASVISSTTYSNNFLQIKTYGRASEGQTTSDDVTLQRCIKQVKLSVLISRR